MNTFNDIESMINEILDGKSPAPSLVPEPKPEPKPMSVAANWIQAKDPEVPQVMAEAIAQANEEPEPVITQHVFTDTPVDTTRIPIPTFDAESLGEVVDVRNFGQLVTLTTKRWHAKAKDRQASKDAARANDAVAEAFDTHKRLLVGADETLKAIHKALDDARARHYTMTLPWSTTGLDDVGRRSGARILPNSMFFEYTEAMAECKNNMNKAIAAFVPAYPSLIERARAKLGKRFDPREYPAVDVIQHHFDLSFDFQPIPTGSDFKGLPQQQLEALARHLNNKTKKMMANAMADVWTRMYEAVSRMAERLSSTDKVFHYTLVENVRETARLAKHLNVMNDLRVERVRTQIERYLTVHDVETLRKQHETRKRVAAYAQSIVEIMQKEALT
jgi:hypothetical protein